jgi:DNA uptake protein ComE-like DNA-binding protein
MRKSSAILLACVGLGMGIYVVLRSLNRNRSIDSLHLTTSDLNYSQVSREEIVSERLVDLNEATASELSGLGLDHETVERLVENRPYRSKLELVSRMVIPEAVFVTIRDKVAISEGRDSVKIA